VTEWEEELPRLYRHLEQQSITKTPVVWCLTPLQGAVRNADGTSSPFVGGRQSHPAVPRRKIKVQCRPNQHCLQTRFVLKHEKSRRAHENTPIVPDPEHSVGGSTVWLPRPYRNRHVAASVLSSFTLFVYRKLSTHQRVVPATFAPSIGWEQRPAQVSGLSSLWAVWEYPNLVESTQLALSTLPDDESRCPDKTGTSS
jgi:hypothetical protein